MICIYLYYDVNFLETKKKPQEAFARFDLVCECDERLIYTPPPEKKGFCVCSVRKTTETLGKDSARVDG